MSEDTFSVETVTSLADVPADAWDALSSASPMTSHGWLRLLEEESGEGVEASYVLIRRNSELVAGVPCYCCRQLSPLMDLNQLMFGRFRKLPEMLRFSFIPAMVVGPYRSYGPRLLLSEALDNEGRKQAAYLLLTSAEKMARARNLPLQIPKISAQDHEVLNLVEQRGYHRTRDFPVSYLDIEWDDFDGYLSYIRAFSPKMRRNIKEEMNRFRRSGIQILELHDPAAHNADLQKLVRGHYERLNEVAFPFSDRFFLRLKQLLGDEVVFYGAFLEDRLIGFVLMLKRGGTAYLPMTGIDRQRTGNEGTYFNLCYYRPILDAITKGLQRLYFGGTLYFPKVRRGCKILGLHHAYLGASPLRHRSMKPWFAFHSTWMRRRVIPLEDLTSLRKGKRD